MQYRRCITHLRVYKRYLIYLAIHDISSTPQKVIADGISRGRAGLDTSSKERPARPSDIPYAITFWGVTVSRTVKCISIASLSLYA